jgi:hypothetical protein
MEPDHTETDQWIPRLSGAVPRRSAKGLTDDDLA